MEPQRQNGVGRLENGVPSEPFYPVRIHQGDNESRQIEWDQNRRSVARCFMRRQVNARPLALLGRFGRSWCVILSRPIAAVVMMTANRLDGLGSRWRTRWQNVRMVPAASKKSMDDQRGDRRAGNDCVHKVLSHRYVHRPQSQASLCKNRQSRRDLPESASCKVEADCAS
jgi:hypothetical protein